MNFLSPFLKAAPAPHRQFIFFAAFAVTLILAIIVPRSLSFLPLLTGLAALGVHAMTGGRKIPFDKILAALLIGILALAALSALWSPDAAFAFKRTWKTGLVFLGGFCLLEAARLFNKDALYKNAVMIFMLAASVIIALCFCYEYESRFALTRLILGIDSVEDMAALHHAFFFNRSLVYFVLLALPLGLGLYLSGVKARVKLGLAIALAVGLCGALYFTRSQTAQMAVFFAAIAALYPAHKLIARRIFMVCVILSLFAAPFIVPHTHKLFFQSPDEQGYNRFMMEASAPHRMEVWNFIALKAFEKPLAGHGIEATRFLKSDRMMAYMDSDNVLHPHNAYLQIWIEFGLAGALFASLFFILLYRRLDRMEPLYQRYYTSLTATLLFVLMVSYGLWQGWLLGMIFTLYGFSIALIRIYPRASTPQP
ncbi:MAG: O-antigen ligase family protein [Micavibrio sp.]